MKNTMYVVGAVIVVVVVAGILLSYPGLIPGMYNSNNAPTGTGSQQQQAAPAQQPATTQTAAPSGPGNSVTPGISDSVTVTTQTAAKTVEVDFTGSAFNPGAIAVNGGDTVVFVNKAVSTDLHVASNPHPVHNGYPQTGSGSCSDAFDSCSSIAPGGNWSFTFNVKGTWGFHDHLDPSITGSITVQ